jgi:hypothetical protein
MRTFIFGSVAIMAAVVVGLGCYFFGAYSERREIWPFPELHAINGKLHPYYRANGEVEDNYHRLVSYRGKVEIPCPAQTDKTLVLLILGQSNAANSGGQRQPVSDHVINYFNGKCYAASSPLLGATGIRGEPWTLLGAKLVAAGRTDQVILIPSAMSGSSVDQWQDGADLNIMLRSVLSGVAPLYRINQILWHQGEYDFGYLTKEQYTKEFMSLIASIRRMGVDAPVYVSVASKCEVTELPWTSSNPIADAQRSLPDPGRGILRGVDSDALVGQMDRLDDCHFGASGEEKFASAWAQILTDR